MITRSRQVALLLFDEVELLDFSGLLQALTLAGRQWNWRPFKIHAVAEKPGLISTCNQLRIEAPVAFQECPKPEILIVPGGYGAVLASRNSAVLTWVASVLHEVEACCTVGNGALVIAGTGKFPGQTVSVAASAAAMLQQQESVLHADTVQRVTLGDTLLSARTSEGSLDLGLQLVERFLGASLRKRVQSELMVVSADPLPIDIAALPRDSIAPEDASD